LRDYAFGQINRWAQMASISPGLANFLTQTPGLRDAAKFLGGISRERAIPRFAARTFRSWFRRHKPHSGAPNRSRKVLLWPDTFNNYFHPETAIAAFEVLEAAGFSVRIPAQNVCCGRPLYDFGMLAQAKRYLQNTLWLLEREIEDEIPVIVLEPSCASVFRDEMPNLFPGDPRAQKLASHVVLFSEFLEAHAESFILPSVNQTALVHGHCHQKSIMKMSSEEAVLQRMRVDYQMPAEGCCGMAGAFGFEKEKYEVSVAIGELELLPAVRTLSPDSLIIADGFSCREQIEQCTGRKALHLAEVVHMGLSADA
jgi:Fe-S oxidoreductase